MVGCNVPVPGNADLCAEVVELVGWARSAAEPIALVPSGGRTGLSGGAVAGAGEVVVSFDRMNDIRDFDPVSRTVVAEAGAITESAAGGLFGGEGMTSKQLVPLFRKVREDDTVIPVMLRSEAANRQDLGNLEGLSVFSQVTDGLQQGRNLFLVGQFGEGLGQHTPTDAVDTSGGSGHSRIVEPY